MYCQAHSTLTPSSAGHARGSAVKVSPASLSPYSGLIPTRWQFPLRGGPACAWPPASVRAWWRRLPPDGCSFSICLGRLDSSAISVAELARMSGRDARGATSLSTTGLQAGEAAFLQGRHVGIRGWRAAGDGEGLHCRLCRIAPPARRPHHQLHFIDMSRCAAAPPL